MIYKIKKGKHGSGLRIPAPILFKKKFNWRVKFNSSAIYTSKIPVNQYDVNKIVGFIEGLDVHGDSARFGWNFFQGQLLLHAYVYNDDERVEEVITQVPIDQWISISIEVTKEAYLFMADGIVMEMKRTVGMPYVCGFKSYPYFGGDETAPHDIIIELETV